MVRRHAQRILALGDDAEEEEQAGHRPVEDEKSSAPKTLGTTYAFPSPATRASVGTSPR